jgi:hypothetical protein
VTLTVLPAHLWEDHPKNKLKNKDMSDTTEEKIDPRQDRLVYSRVNPITDEVKTKINAAFLDVVNRFKDKHLS